MTNRLPGFETILDLAKEGRRLFPLRLGSKKPAITDWPNFATSNIQQIERLADQFPNCNWGMATGAGSGVWTVDADQKNGKDGSASLKEIGAERWPATRTIKTPHGTQFHFACNGNEIRNTVGILPGVDVRGDGGLAVVPPSVLTNCDIKGCTATEHVYKYLDKRLPVACSDAEQFYLSRKGKPEVEIPDNGAKLGPGRRYPHLLSVTGLLRAKGLSLEATYAAVWQENIECCEPPKTEAEIRKLVKDIFSRYEAEAVPVIGARPEELDSKFVCIEDALANVQVEPDWIVEGIVPSGSQLALVAKIKQGKTTLVLDLSRHIISGEVWCGQRVKQGSVLYLTEQPRNSFNSEVMIAGITSGLTVLYRHEVNKYQWPQIAKSAIERARNQNCRLIVVDTLTKWAGATGDRENRGEIAVLDALSPAYEFGCSILCVYHSGHAGDSRDVWDAIRGGTGWGGEADMIYRLRRPRDKQDQTIRLLETVGRYQDFIPGQIGLLWGNHRYTLLPASGEKITAANVHRVLDRLPSRPEDAWTRKQIEDATRASWKTILRVMEDRTDIQKVGSGTWLSPYKYFRQNPTVQDSSGHTPSTGRDSSVHTPSKEGGLCIDENPPPSDSPHAINGKDVKDGRTLHAEPTPRKSEKQYAQMDFENGQTLSTAKPTDGRDSGGGGDRVQRPLVTPDFRHSEDAGSNLGDSREGDIPLNADTSFNPAEWKDVEPAEPEPDEATTEADAACFARRSGSGLESDNMFKAVLTHCQSVGKV